MISVALLEMLPNRCQPSLFGWLTWSMRCGDRSGQKVLVVHSAPDRYRYALTTRTGQSSRGKSKQTTTLSKDEDIPSYLLMMSGSWAITQLRMWSNRRIIGRPSVVRRRYQTLHRAQNQNRFLKVSEEIQDALNTGKPVVALETTIYTHGR